MWGIRWGIALVAASLVACGGTEGSGDAGIADAAGDASTEPAPPEAPRIDWLGAGEPAIAPPAPPVIGPCASGWRAIEVDGVAACDPWPEAGAPTCDDTSLVTPGTTACVRVGSACPADGWPATLPASGVRHVRPGASGGDGSRGAPFGTIAQALTGITAGTTIALAAGVHVGPPVVLPAGVTVIGACASGTTIRTDVADTEVGVIDVAGADVVIRDVSITGPRVGISLSGSGRGLVLEDAIVHGVVRYGLRIVGDHVVRVRRTLLRDVVAPASTGRGGRGAQIESAADVIFESIEVRDVVSAAIASFDPGTTTVVRDAWLHGVAGDPTLEFVGIGIVSGTGGAVTAERIAIANVHYSGVICSNPGSTMTVSDLHVRDVEAGDPTRANGFGIAANGSSTLTARRATVIRTTAAGLRVEDGATLDVADTIVSEVRESAIGEGRGASAQASTLRLERVQLAHAHEFGILAFQGATVEGTDLVVDDVAPSMRAPLGVGARADASTMTLERAVLRSVEPVGLSAYGDGTVVTVTDARIGPVDAIELEGLFASIGVFAEERARVTLSRVAIEGATENLVGASSAEVTAEDCVFDSIDSPLERVVDSTGVLGRGGASITLRRARIAAAVAYGLAIADPETHLVVEDLVLDDTRVVGLEGGYAIGILGSQAEIRRAQVRTTAGGALFASAGATVLTTDLAVAMAGGAPDRVHFAVTAHGPETGLTLERAQVDDVRGIALSASGGATVIASDVVASQTLESACTTCPELFGSAVVVGAASSLELRRFRLEDVALVGLQIRSPNVVLEHGEIARASIGVNLQVDLAPTVFSTVDLVDNEVDLDARELPVPEPTPPDAPSPAL